MSGQFERGILPPIGQPGDRDPIGGRRRRARKAGNAFLFFAPADLRERLAGLAAR